MKKTLIFLAVVVIAVVMSGCSKDCTCTTTSENPYLEEPVVLNSTVHIDKGNCKSLNTSQTQTVMDVTITTKVECH